MREQTQYRGEEGAGLGSGQEVEGQAASVEDRNGSGRRVGFKQCLKAGGKGWTVCSMRQLRDRASRLTASVRKKRREVMGLRKAKEGNGWEGKGEEGRRREGLRVKAGSEPDRSRRERGRRPCSS